MQKSHAFFGFPIKSLSQTRQGVLNNEQRADKVSELLKNCRFSGKKNEMA
jgi:hypothetical protein